MEPALFDWREFLNELHWIPLLDGGNIGLVPDVLAGERVAAMEPAANQRKHTGPPT